MKLRKNSDNNEHCIGMAIIFIFCSHSSTESLRNSMPQNIPDW